MYSRFSCDFKSSLLFVFAPRTHTGSGLSSPAKPCRHVHPSPPAIPYSLQRQVLSENGVIVIRGPREEVGSTAGIKETKGVGEASSSWHGIAGLWEAIAGEACNGEHGFAAAVGDLDG